MAIYQLGQIVAFGFFGYMQKTRQILFQTKTDNDKVKKSNPPTNKPEKLQHARSNNKTKNFENCKKTQINSQRNKCTNNNWQLSQKNVTNRLQCPVNKHWTGIIALNLTITMQCFFETEF